MKAELTISLGGVVGHLALRDAAPAFVEVMRARYAPFMVPSAQWVRRDFSIEITLRPRAPGRSVAQGQVPIVSARETETTLTIERAGARAELKLTPPERPNADDPCWIGTASCEMNQYFLDSLLRVIWSVLLSRAGGALLHACGLRDDQAGLVFAGESGAGKSTLSRKMPDPDQVLSDEQVAVYRDGDGQWRVAGTPFWGDFSRPGGSLRSWPLRALCFLEQSGALGVKPASLATATRRVLACYMCYQDDVVVAARNLQVAMDLCSSVPTVVVGSRRDTPCRSIFAAVRPHLGVDVTVQQPAPTVRESISELRWSIEKYGTFAYLPRGPSMRPHIRTGDSVLLEKVQLGDLKPGDIVLYWTPGALAHEDRLTCHRLVAAVETADPGVAAFYAKGDALSSIQLVRNDRQSEILGRVAAVSRDGKNWERTKEWERVAWLAASLAMTPLLRLRGL